MILMVWAIVPIYHGIRSPFQLPYHPMSLGVNFSNTDIMPDTDSSVVRSALEPPISVMTQLEFAPISDYFSHKLFLINNLACTYPG